MTKQEATKAGKIAVTQGMPVKPPKKKKRSLRLPGMMKTLTAAEIVDKALDELCGKKKRYRRSK